MSKRMRLTRADVVAFMRQVPLVAFATASVEGRPEAALVCAAVRDNLEVVIDMADDSRKFLNLQRNVRVAEAHRHASLQVRKREIRCSITTVKRPNEREQSGVLRYGH